MLKLVLLSFWVCMCTAALAEKQSEKVAGSEGTDSSAVSVKSHVRHKFAGGMFYHIGMGNVSMATENINGVSMGMGGKLAFSVGPWLRIGGMGFNTGFDYESIPGVKESFVSLRFGGLSAEFVFPLTVPVFSFGVCFGGGRLEQLHIVSTTDNLKLVLYDKYSTMIAMPFILVAYPIGKKVSLSFMTDWIVGTKIIAGNSFGPRANIGILFNR